MSTNLPELWADTGCIVGESPRWDAAAGRLTWVDIPAGNIWIGERDGAVRCLQIGREIGVATPRVGGFLVAARGGFFTVDDNGRERSITGLPEDWSVMRMNDGACDARGRMLAGSTSLTSGGAAGRLYQLHPDGQVRVLLHGIGMSNGVGWSPDGRRMYHADSLAGTITVYEYDLATGDLGPRIAVAQIDAGEGMPDGLTVDADGFVWAAIWGAGRLRRLSADGKPVLDLPVGPRFVTACAFGGPALDELYITTARWDLNAAQLRDQPGAGGVFRTAVGVTGLPANLFG